MRLILTSAVIFIFGLLSGCGNKEIAEKASFNPAKATNKFDGHWEVIGITDAPKEGSTDGSCNYALAKGIMIIKNGAISGKLKDQADYNYILKGQVVDSGKMVGGLTYEDHDAATYDGTLTATDGKGLWKDIYGCPGSWQMIRKQLARESGTAAQANDAAPHESKEGS
jgi:hypothetical protein